MCRIRDHLINSNVQLGATYEVGKQATSRYEEGYQAAAKYINASRDEIGLHPCPPPPPPSSPKTENAMQLPN